MPSAPARLVGVMHCPSSGLLAISVVIICKTRPSCRMQKQGSAKQHWAADKVPDCLVKMCWALEDVGAAGRCGRCWQAKCHLPSPSTTCVVQGQHCCCACRLQSWGTNYVITQGLCSGPHRHSRLTSICSIADEPHQLGIRLLQVGQCLAGVSSGPHVSQDPHPAGARCVQCHTSGKVWALLARPACQPGISTARCRQRPSCGGGTMHS